MLNHLSFAEFDRLIRVASSALCALLALACLWLMAQIVWTLLSRHDESAAVVTAPAPMAANNAAAVSVAKWHLFGNPQSLASQLVRNAPATTLKLNLHGTLALDDPKTGMAMIADEQGIEESYRIGDELPGGAKLQEVYTDHVILAHEGALETLALPHPEQHASPQIAPGVPALSGANPLAAKGGNGITPSVAPIYQAPIMAGGAVDWNKARTQVIQNPADLAGRVKMVQENGKIVGVQLTNASDTAMFASAGLQAGDIITAVNGTAVSDVGGIQQLFANTKSGTQLQVSVQRAGKPATLTVNLK